MKIALAQINSILGDLDKNLQIHINYCEEAVAKGADTIVFPELSLTGYSLKDLNYEVAINLCSSKKLDKLTELSKNIDIVFGFAEESKSYAIYNSSAYLTDEKVVHVHRKIYPPTYTIFEELRYFSAGKKCDVFETKFGTTGMLVCEDMWHLSLPYTQAMKGAKIIFGIAASPTRMGIKTEGFKNYEINSEQHKTFARLLSLYFVFTNRVGYEDGVNFWGGSEIIDPFGNIVAAGRIFEEELITADVDMNEVRRARLSARHFLDENPELTIKNLKDIPDSE